MIRIVFKNDVVLPPLPKWPDGPVVQVPWQKVPEAVRRHVPFFSQDIPSDNTYLAVPDALLEPAVAWTLRSLDAMGISYGPDSFDCENFQRELCQVLCKIARRAGVKGTPCTGGLSVRMTAPWGGVPAGGAHQVAVAWTVNRGLVVIEPQARQFVSCPLDEYPNRTGIFSLSDF